VQFVRERHGAEAIRRWYAGESLEAVTGHGMEQLDRMFRAELEKVPLPDAVLVSARARFDRPSFFERRCPRVIDRLASDAGARLGMGDLRGAREGYREVLALDPRDAGARFGLAACAAREGQLDRARNAYAALAKEQDSPMWARLAALEAEGDLLLREGRLEEAREAYAQLAKDLVDADRLRTLDVKRRAAQSLGREAVVMLLIGDELGPSWDVAAGKLGEWSALDPRDGGLADYLLGRNLSQRGRYRNAAEYLERSLARGLPDASVLDEALRLRMIAACATGDLAAADRARERLAGRLSSRARRGSLARFAERCGILATAPVP
jgi:tetratricopeptide (TPR) repeat protein